MKISYLRVYISDVDTPLVVKEYHVCISLGIYAKIHLFILNTHEKSHKYIMKISLLIITLRTLEVTF